MEASVGFRPLEASARPQINIYGEMHDKREAAEATPAPTQEPAQPAPVQETAEEWFHRIRDEAVHHAAEQRAADDIAAGREQSLYAVAVDPVGHYAQQAADDAAFNRALAEAQAEQTQKQEQRL